MLLELRCVSLPQRRTLDELSIGYNSTTLKTYEDSYNFDETGFQMGVIATAPVVTGTDRAGRPRTVQPGNRE
jgi:hypothetical protein